MAESKKPWYHAPAKGLNPRCTWNTVPALTTVLPLAPPHAFRRPRLNPKVLWMALMMLLVGFSQEDHHRG